MDGCSKVHFLGLRCYGLHYLPLFTTPIHFPPLNRLSNGHSSLVLLLWKPTLPCLLTCTLAACGTFHRLLYVSPQFQSLLQCTTPFSRLVQYLLDTSIRLPDSSSIFHSNLRLSGSFYSLLYISNLEDRRPALSLVFCTIQDHHHSFLKCDTSCSESPFFSKCV